MRYSDLRPFIMLFSCINEEVYDRIIFIDV